MRGAVGLALSATLLLPGAVSALLSGSASAQSVESFYRGKQIRLVIGFGPGGGYDLYARTLAQHMGPHIPGNPTIVPQNVPSGGNVQVANDLYNVLPRDGTVFAAFASGVPAAPFFSPDQAKFDPAKLTWIGSANTETQIDYVWHTAPVRTLEELKTHELIIGGDSPGDATVDYPLLDNAVLGLKYKLIMGYKSTSEIDLALERGEVFGNAGVAWGSLKTRHPDWIKDGKVIVIAQYGAVKHPELPDVPQILTLAHNDADREALDLMFSRQEMGRPFAAPPEMPADRAAALRRAFDDTMKDPAFLADAAQRRLEILPMSGEAVAAIVQKVVATPPDVVERVKKILSGASQKEK
jgi:tripartite-type tricarboxylate transporter receptor subunit TctC